MSDRFFTTVHVTRPSERAQKRTGRTRTITTRGLGASVSRVFNDAGVFLHGNVTDVKTRAIKRFVYLCIGIPLEIIVFKRLPEASLQPVVPSIQRNSLFLSVERIKLYRRGV